MGFQFAETMTGTVEWDGEPGVSHPFSFSVRAIAESTRAHMRDGRARLTGVLTAPPIAQAAPLEGVITIRPVGQRIIRYELMFVGSNDGKRYELVGQKDIRWRAPLRTFTRLPAEILDAEHRRIGTCKSTFDLRHDGWRFLRSFRPI